MDYYATARQMVKLPAKDRQTFIYSAPIATHYRTVTCQEAAQWGECKHYTEGFVLPLTPDKDVALIVSQLNAAHYKFSLCDTPLGFPPGTQTFFFPAEQQCLESRGNPHKIPLDRPPKLAVVRGDFREYDRTTLERYSNAGDWVDKFRNHQDSLDNEIRK